MSKFDRTKRLIGEENINKLEQSTVAVFGIGGVGSFTVEALARSAVGKLILIDGDVIDETNINRQIHANVNTVGKWKTEVMRDRILEINPNLQVEIYSERYSSEKRDMVSTDYDYIVDAIDSVPDKLDLIETAYSRGIRIISSMGAGNKLDPTQFEVVDIYDTSVCPLAKKVRSELRKRDVGHLKVVFSKEEPVKVEGIGPASIAFVPSVAGLIIAGEVVKDIIKE